MSNRLQQDYLLSLRLVPSPLRCCDRNSLGLWLASKVPVCNTSASALLRSARAVSASFRCPKVYLAIVLGA